MESINITIPMLLMIFSVFSLIVFEEKLNMKAPMIKKKTIVSLVDFLIL